MRLIHSTTISHFINFVKTHWIGFSIPILATITVLSLLPLDNLPPAPGNDKLQHVIAYAILMFPAALRKARRWVVLCFFFIAYSGVIELLQPLVNRYCDGGDMMANISGVVCGVILAGVVNLLFRANTSLVR